MNYKKKFLNKINILIEQITAFDLLLAVVFLLILSWILLQTSSKKEWFLVEVKTPLQFWGQSYESAPPFLLGESINIGDKEYDSGGGKIAEVLDKKEYESTSERPSRKEVYLTLNLKVDKNKKTSKLSFKNQALEVGSPIELHLTNTFIEGRVVFIENPAEKIEEKEILVNGIWQDAYPWVAEAISIKGEMKDTAGNIAAQILEKEIKLAEKTVETADGRLVIAWDPLKRDVNIKAKLKVRKQGNNLYFYNDQKIRIGGFIWIFLPGIDIEELNITGIFDLDGNKLY
jgi:hypothetical protein